MDFPELLGTLSGGKRYRVTTYSVEILEPSGEALDTIDIQDVTAVERRGRTVYIDTPTDQLSLTGATLGDAGRLDAMLKSLVRTSSATYRQPQPVRGKVMFGHLTDFGYQRHGREVFGFYLAYLLLFVLLYLPFFVVLRNLYGLGSGSVSVSASGLGVILGVIFSVTLGSIIAQHKQVEGAHKIIIAAIVLSILGGGVLGLAPIVISRVDKTVSSFRAVD